MRRYTRINLPRDSASAHGYLLLLTLFALKFVYYTRDLDIRRYSMQQHELLDNQNRVLHLNVYAHKIAPEKLRCVSPKCEMKAHLAQNSSPNQLRSVPAVHTFNYEQHLLKLGFRK